MGILGKFLNKDSSESISKSPFAAQIIFECGLVLQNKQIVKLAIEEFADKFSANIATSPKITQATDGNVIEITVYCDSKDELLYLNKELEQIAQHYGLR